MGQLLEGVRITRDRRPSKPRLPVTALEVHMLLRAMLKKAETKPVISARNTPDVTDIGRRCGLARILNGSEKLNKTMDALGKMNEVVTANTKALSFLGARAMVLGKFLEAALPRLTPLQRVEITLSFREGIEDALSLMDDVALPAEYHSALLELTNSILAALSREPTGRQ